MYAHLQLESCLQLATLFLFVQSECVVGVRDGLPVYSSLMRALWLGGTTGPLTLLRTNTAEGFLKTESNRGMVLMTPLRADWMPSRKGRLGRDGFAGSPAEQMNRLEFLAITKFYTRINLQQTL
ncbi:hypothetical protein G7K_6159-t1 [Saitoella complicata NRRL Y-17804]|uniref:Secreted protein n=1 Tax=Saitoella complicata (strain BCRC 22490 / CBS 7301 / JCM 7358 / NBRC 10748 / NRRL Y-17804) TaxID=698492 RepID=A0A0E9NQK0_SAICN|nr:hypothetical protein G7K_6159-t1 [Saitoella complicata NRRL Y-17804]